MIFKLISYIHRKPRHIRGLIAFGASVFLTLIIGVVWLVSYTNYVNEKINSESAISFSSIYKKMKGSAPEVSRLISTSIEVATVLSVLSQEVASLEETATSSEDESVKATTSSEDLIQ